MTDPKRGERCGFPGCEGHPARPDAPEKCNASGPYGDCPQHGDACLVTSQPAPREQEASLWAVYHSDACFFKEYPDIYWKRPNFEDAEWLSRHGGCRIVEFVPKQREEGS